MRAGVLVVDDDDGVRQSLRRGLSAHGYQVFLAHDAVSALYAANHHTLERAILDQRLQGPLGDRSGLDVAEKLLVAHPRMRVVIHTGYGTSDAAFRAAQAGAVHYLEKPATLDEVVAALEGRGPMTPPPRPATLDRVERDHILRVLADHGGNLTRAAEALGISRDSLRRALAAKRRRGR